jgi:hypothetical protein
VTGERTADAKRRAIERGVPPFPNVPPGFRKRADGRLERDDHGRAVVKAFRLRDKGATITKVREFLAEQGIERSYHGVQGMLTSRIYLGELRFGQIINENAHKPLIDRATFERVQRRAVSRGRRAKSERLLARLGVLRCGTCGARMVVGTANHGGYSLYRCPPVGDCSRRVTVSAEIAEEVVADAVQEAIVGMRGTATISDGVDEAERTLDRCEQQLEAAVRAFTGLDDVDATRERLLELRTERDRARDLVGELRAAASPALTVSAGDWGTLTIDEKRALIRAVVDRADVVPGRGPDRITVYLRGE